MSTKDKKYSIPVYSTISGYNIYYFPSDFSNTQMETALHLPSDEIVNVLPLEGTLPQNLIPWYRKMFLKPMLHDFFEWPIDYVIARIKNKKIPCLIFDKRAYPNMEPIRNILYQPIGSTELDWKNPETLTLCKNIAFALDRLDHAGYAYHNFDINRILFHRKTGNVRFLFCHQIRPLTNETVYDSVNSKELAQYFLPPYIYNSQKPREFMDANVDYYQITALLFRLMIGRLPYEGRALINEGHIFIPDIDCDEDWYFEHYHNYPHFIFDPEDTTNALASTFEEEAPKQRWQSLPQKVRDMFQLTLCQSTAKGVIQENLPSPSDWLSVLTEFSNQPGKLKINGNEEKLC